jgi:sterol 3beta-glucosyltransferase
MGRSLSRSESYRRGDKSPLSPKPDGSSTSVTNSIDRETELSAAIQSLDDTNDSASQILNRSDVFQTPTIQKAARKISDADAEQLRYSQDTARSGRAGKATPLSAGSLRNKAARPQPLTDMEDEDNLHASSMRPSGSSSALQNIMQAGSIPLQKASGMVGFMRNRSKRMSNLLATDVAGYYEKVTGMWAGGRKHYNTAEGLEPEDHIRGADEDEDAVNAGERFRDYFALDPTEELQAIFFGHFHRVLPMYGKIYIGDRHFCYRSLMSPLRTKVRFQSTNITKI